MNTKGDWRFGFVAAAVALIIGCAHSGSDPFLTATDRLIRVRADPPRCFTAPLTECVFEPGEGEPANRLASPWRGSFEPDLAGARA